VPGPADALRACSKTVWGLRCGHAVQPCATWQPPRACERALVVLTRASLDQSRWHGAAPAFRARAQAGGRAAVAEAQLRQAQARAADLGARLQRGLARVAELERRLGLQVRPGCRVWLWWRAAGRVARRSPGMAESGAECRWPRRARGRRARSARACVRSRVAPAGLRAGPLQGAAARRGRCRAHRSGSNPRRMPCAVPCSAGGAPGHVGRCTPEPPCLWPYSGGRRGRAPRAPG